jgi:hypothetical protein
MAIPESARNKLRADQAARGQNDCVIMMRGLLLIMWECDGMMMTLREMSLECV